VAAVPRSDGGPARRALVALGVGQCVNWGVLYYAFAVLLLPLQRELRQPTWIVAGAFSVALLMSAAAAPRVGAWCDAGHGAIVMQVGGVTAAVVLALWTVVPGVASLYVAWAVLGLCMAATLYEPAFIIVGQMSAHPEQRLRALAFVTLFGGLASTVFLPGAAFLISRLGWRGTVLVLATAVAVSTAVTRLLVFRREPRTTALADVVRSPHTPRGLAPARFAVIAGLFALATLASAGFVANLVPTLSERGVSPRTAAALGGLIGVMQLPGRALLMNGTFRTTASGLLTLSLGLYALGFLGVAYAASIVAIAAGTAVFALGAGITTLVRPHLVHELTGGTASGYVNGRIARRQQLSRAAGPLTIAALAHLVGYTTALSVVAALFLISALAWQIIGSRMRPS
jgi:MFS family permease